MTDTGLGTKVGLDVENLNLENMDGETDGQVGLSDPYQLVYDVKEEDSSDSDPNSGEMVDCASQDQPQESNPLLAYLPGEDNEGGSKELETSSISSARSREGTPSTPRSTPDISAGNQVDGKSDNVTAEKEAPDVFTEEKQTVAKGASGTPAIPPTLPPIPPTQPTKMGANKPVRSQSTSSATIPTSTSDQQYEPTFIYRGVIYLGSTTVNAPISEVEANRKIKILRMHSDAAQAIPINLLVPTLSTGRVILKDPEQDQPLTVFPVKTILFCVRGKGPDLSDCFAFNVKHRTSGIFHCHVFQCENVQECARVFNAVGNAFKKKKPTVSLSDDNNQLLQEFDVTLDISEDDGKGSYTPVSMDKDCFKLRQNMLKKVAVAISQPNTERPLLIERCSGLLLSPGKNVKHSEMNLLDMMKMSLGADKSVIITGIWNPTLPFSILLNEETPKSSRLSLTVAIDIIFHSVAEPVRFVREVKVRVLKSDPLAWVTGSLTRRKTSTESFLLTLVRSSDSSTKNTIYTVKGLVSTATRKKDTSSSPLVSPKNHKSITPHGDMPTSPTNLNADHKQHPQVSKVKEAAGDESDNSLQLDEDEDEVLASGWGEVDNSAFRDDVMTEWGALLEKWDGREKSRPKQLVKLCRQGIPNALRGQVWQMLAGTTFDPQLQDAYRLLITKSSPTEDVISWDIKRTYVAHDYFKDEEGKEALYKISKAYSVYDGEIGYCQGLSFIIAVLLLEKMPEEQAFSVLVKIMFNYGHRDMFKPGFELLHCMLFQLDKLLEDVMPDLHAHLVNERVESHMFASQWFLTLYTAKFPLPVVFHIVDLYLCEGIKTIFQVALALLKISRKDLLSHDFEGIMKYFRVHLPKKFTADEECAHLFQTIDSMKVTERKLKKYDKEYQAYRDSLAQEEDPIKRLERENKRLQENILRLEHENDTLAQELVSSKITLRTEMDKLEERIDTLSKEGRTHKSGREAANILIAEVQEELQQVKEMYQKVAMQLTEERQQHVTAIEEFKQTIKLLDEKNRSQQENLRKELQAVKQNKLQKPTESSQGDESQEVAIVTNDDSAEEQCRKAENRLHEVELELASTKLQLVESRCQVQELDHKLSEVLQEPQQKGWWFGRKNT